MKATRKHVVQQPLENLSDFFRRFEKHKISPVSIDIYRGHADEKYDLKPWLLRLSKNRKDEKNILRELISLHPSEFATDKSVFEQLVRMQHHSMPTRLLDLTFNPLVALYFACRGEKEREADGEFVRLSVPKFQIRYFDSDTVSCVANLSNLTGKERDYLRKEATQKNLGESHAGKRLLQFIRAEKPYFLPEMKLDDLKKILVVKPKQSNRRILAQQGAFLLYGLTSVLDDDNDMRIKIIRTRIPSVAKNHILQQLNRININESSLFPEIERAALYIMRQFTPIAGNEKD
jgi:hypothetical protein